MEVPTVAVTCGGIVVGAGKVKEGRQKSFLVNVGVHEIGWLRCVVDEIRSAGSSVAAAWCWLLKDFHSSSEIQ